LFIFQPYIPNQIPKEGIMKKPILVIGSSNTDMILRSEKIPRPGETILGGEFSMAAGGKGANQAVAAARAGGRVIFLARVGDDIFGRQAVQGFKRDKIDVRHVLTDRSSPSGVALIFVAESGENCIGVASGANGLLSPADVQKQEQLIAEAALVVLQLEIPLETVETAARLAAKHGVTVILNPAPARALPKSLLANISLLTPNETETEMLTGIPVRNEASVRRAASALRDKGVGAVIITLGARGAYASSSEFTGLVPGCRVKAKDTTAAGDVFNGALAVALSEGKGLKEALRFANAAAAVSVTCPGAQPSCPKRIRIERQMRQIYFI
jgi:ribokinase